MSSAPRWEQERGNRTHTPFRPFIRRFGVVASTDGELYRLLAKIVDVADNQIERQRPLFRGPVIGKLGVERERGGILPGICQERRSTRCAPSLSAT